MAGQCRTARKPTQLLSRHKSISQASAVSRLLPIFVAVLVSFWSQQHFASLQGFMGDIRFARGALPAALAVACQTSE